MSLDFKLRFLGVIEALYWRAPNLVFLGVIPYWIRILGMMFISLATFVILHPFSVWIRACGYFYESQ